MDAVKRTRQDPKNYNEVRNYRKRPKATSDVVGKNTPVQALIFDNGGYSIKIGYSTDKTPINLPNCIMKAKSERKRVFVADQIADCRDLSGLYYMYPHEKGYITKFDIQKNVWDYTFTKFPIDDKTVMLTQPIFNFRTIQEYTDEIFFEEYDVRSLHKANATDYCYYNYAKQHKKGLDSSCLVVDSGFSFTHIVPYIKGKKYAEGIIRLNLGGKLLTNYLKDILSYRQLHVMEETYVINQVKEDLCFMSQNFKADMRRAKTTNEIVKNYVLPDFHSIRRGYIHDNPTAELAESCQILRLNNERIAIPEVMLRPSIITGLEFAGLAECIGHAIKRCPKEYQSGLAGNVVLCGGNSMFPGFRNRLEQETRIFLPCDYELKMFQPDDPLNYAWFGAKLMSNDPKLRKRCVTKQKYEEEGSDHLYDKFNVFCELGDDSPKDVNGDNEGFSYLNYWKNEGVDIFQKEALLPVKDPDLQFKLEGENIEEYDGKYVTLDFEIEKPVEEEKEEDETAKYLRRKRSLATLVPPSPVASPVQRTIQTIPSLQTIPTVIATLGLKTPTLTTLTTNVASRTITTLTSLSPQLLSAVGNAKPGQVITIPQHLLQAQVPRMSIPNVLNSNIILPKLTRIQPRVMRPTIYKTVKAGAGVVTSQAGKITQYISLGNTMNLSDAIMVPSTAAGGAQTVMAPSILNNAVIIPQNMLSSKNLTFQIVPIKPDMVRQGNIILTQTKTTQD